MEKREQIVKGFYAHYAEENRLDGSKQGKIEYITTMHYIHKYLNDGQKVAEIGAGTGRLSIELAKEGFDVTAVEYSDSNFDKLQKNAEEIPNIKTFHGDAVRLDMLDDESFDMTMLFGPMYHLYTQDEQLTALREAKRITKKGGIILIAFLSVYAIMNNNYVCSQCGSFIDGFNENFTENLENRHFAEQLFTGFDIVEFEQLLAKAPLEIKTIVSTDGILELAEGRKDFGLEGENFDKYVKYHLAFCEKRELLGSSSHLLAVCRNQ